MKEIDLSNYKTFVTLLESKQQKEDEATGRVYNQDTFGHWVRELSRRLTYLFFLAGLHGPHVLFAHFIVDLVALYFVYLGSPLIALALWLLAHILDNCDGDLARARDEARPEWGHLDVLLHAWGNMIFWPILGFLTGSWYIVTLILALRVIMEHHRGQFKMVGDRYGERSQLWKWVAHPTNINIMYTAYVPFALAGQLEWYLYGYLGYYLLAALGQGIAFTLKVNRLN